VQQVDAAAGRQLALLQQLACVALQVYGQLVDAVLRGVERPARVLEVLVVVGLSDKWVLVGMIAELLQLVIMAQLFCDECFALGTAHGCEAQPMQR
jgi:hypothetical protein